MLQAIGDELLSGTGVHVWLLLAGVVLCVLGSAVSIGWLGWRLFRQSNLLLAGAGFVVLVVDFFWACYLVWIVAWCLYIYIGFKLS